jgi:hypothetical protein
MDLKTQQDRKNLLYFSVFFIVVVIIVTGVLNTIFDSDNKYKFNISLYLINLGKILNGYIIQNLDIFIV